MLSIQILCKSAIAFEKSILIEFSNWKPDTNTLIQYLNISNNIIVLCSLDLLRLYEGCLVFLTFVPKETQGHGTN